MKKTKGLFPEKYLWKGEVCSGTVNYAHISGYAGLRRPTRKRLKAMRDEKTALSLFLRRKDYFVIYIICLNLKEASHLWHFHKCLVLLTLPVFFLQPQVISLSLDLPCQCIKDLDLFF